MENIKNNEYFLRLITDNKINLHQKILIISKSRKFQIDSVSEIVLNFLRGNFNNSLNSDILKRLKRKRKLLRRIGSARTSLKIRKEIIPKVLNIISSLISITLQHLPQQ
jgi:hypothetical protein